MMAKKYCLVSPRHRRSRSCDLLGEEDDDDDKNPLIDLELGGGDGEKDGQS